MLLKTRLLISVAAVAAVSPAIAPASAQSISSFTPGDVVVSVEGNGGNTGDYTDNQAAPLTLYEYGSSGTGFVGSFALPQSNSGANFAVSGEYGSSSEGTLQLSGDGRYLTIAGIRRQREAFNANPGGYVRPDQHGSRPIGKPDRPGLHRRSPRGRADRAEWLRRFLDRAYQRFQRQQPAQRLHGQRNGLLCLGPGHYPDATGGVFYAPSAAIRRLDHRRRRRRRHVAGHPRCQVYNGQLYVSTDSKRARPTAITSARSARRERLPTSEANGGNGPAMLPGFGNSGGTGKITVTAANANTSTPASSAKQTVNLSPENYFFANAYTLYVADSGAPKNTSANSPLGDGGLQKWTLSNGTWTLDYTLSAGLISSRTAATSGSTGLYGLTGKDVTVDGVQEVELFATNYTIGDTDPDLSLRDHRRAGRPHRASRRELRRA